MLKVPQEIPYKLGLRRRRSMLKSFLLISVETRISMLAVFGASYDVDVIIALNFCLASRLTNDLAEGLCSKR